MALPLQQNKLMQELLKGAIMLAKLLEQPML